MEQGPDALDVGAFIKEKMRLVEQLLVADENIRRTVLFYRDESARSVQDLIECGKQQTRAAAQWSQKVEGHMRVSMRGIYDPQLNGNLLQYEFQSTVNNMQRRAIDDLKIELRRHARWHAGLITRQETNLNMMEKSVSEFILQKQQTQRELLELYRTNPVHAKQEHRPVLMPPLPQSMALDPYPAPMGMNPEDYSNQFATIMTKLQPVPDRPIPLWSLQSPTHRQLSAPRQNPVPIVPTAPAETDCAPGASHQRSVRSPSVLNIDCEAGPSRQKSTQPPSVVDIECEPGPSRQESVQSPPVLKMECAPSGPSRTTAPLLSPLITLKSPTQPKPVPTQHEPGSSGTTSAPKSHTMHTRVTRSGRVTKTGRATTIKQRLTARKAARLQRRESF